MNNDTLRSVHFNSSLGNLFKYQSRTTKYLTIVVNKDNKMNVVQLQKYMMSGCFPVRYMDYSVHYAPVRCERPGLFQFLERLFNT